MLRLMLQVQFILLTISINAYLYRLKSIPVIRKCIPSSCYAKMRAKYIVSIIVMLRKVIWSIIKKILYIFFAFMVPCILTDLLYGETFTAQNIEAMFCYYFLMLNLLFGSIYYYALREDVEQSFIMIKQMRISPKPYYLVMFFERCILQTAAMLPAIAIFSCGYLQMSEEHALRLCVLLAAMRAIGIAIWLYLVDRDRGSVRTMISMILILPLTYGGGLLVKGNTLIIQVLFHPLTLIVTLVLAAIAICYLITYQGYQEFAIKQIQLNDMKAMDDDPKEISEDTIKISESQLDEKTVRENKYSHLKGYEYLNAIFFDRHKKQVRQKYKRKLIGFGVGILAVMAIIFFMRWTGRAIYTDTNWNKLCGCVILLLYVASSGENVCAALFYHCDMALLKYGYYRDSKTILTNFKIRLRYLILLDLIPALELCVGLSLCILMTGQFGKLVEAIPVLLLIPCISVFFSMYELFLYYVFQPYLENYTKTSGGYRFWYGLMNFVCFFALKYMKFDAYETTLVLILIILWIPICLFLIYRLAPKRFKLH